MDYETARNMPPIEADDPDVLEKVKARLEAYKVEHQRRKAINDYYRRFKTLKGCPGVTPEEAEHLMANLGPSCKGNPIPFGKKPMDSILGSIRSFEKRIADLERWEREKPEGWRFDGGEVVLNTKISRIQIFFDTKADVDTVINLRVNGFLWLPEVGDHGAWQKALTERNIETARLILSDKIL